MILCVSATPAIDLRMRLEMTNWLGSFSAPYVTAASS